MAIDPHQLDEAYMREAIAEAHKAAAIGEVPIGAVVVDPDGAIAGRGHNLRETAQDPTAHAELIAVREAAAKLGSWRLTGCSLYVTIEPCPMCAGAIVLARIDRVVYGAADPKAGAVDTLYDLLRDPRLNHRADVTSGVLQGECAALMQDFFRKLRSRALSIRASSLRKGV